MEFKNKIISDLRKKASENKKKIVLVEGTEDRTLKAVEYLLNNNLVDLILLGNKEEISDKINTLNLNIDLNSSNLEIIDPVNFKELDSFSEELYNLRKNKGLTLEDAKKLISDLTYFGIMLVYKNYADGLVSGAIHSTADTVRPALQILKTKEGIKKVSGSFLMLINDKKYIFSDCAINIEPTSEELSEIAYLSSETAKAFDLDPKVALLSFSTKGSAKHPLVDKVVEAVKISKEKYPDVLIDGEFQLDAAIVPEVSKLKSPDSLLEGKANVLIFPDLQSGNIGYKLVQRFANAEAIGPFLQGIKKPVNDLSRGCSVDDIINVVCVTSIQATNN